MKIDTMDAIENELLNLRLAIYQAGPFPDDCSALYDLVQSKLEEACEAIRQERNAAKA